MYRLQKSLKNLSAGSGAGSLRLFGLIRGAQKDYYIAEGEAGEGEGGEEGGEGGEEPPADMEAKGAGVNAHTYWVAHSSFATYDADPKKSEW